MTATPPPVPRRGRAVRVVVPVLAVLGLVLLGTFAPGTAALLSGAGALLLGGAVGFVAGRRSRPAADELCVARAVNT